MHSSALNIDLSQVNGSAFLKVAGDIDSHSVVELRGVLERLGLDKQVVVDMSGVRFMDSSGINALIDRIVRAEGAGGSLRISKPSRPVERLVELTGLAHLFFSTRDHCQQGAGGEPIAH